VAVVADNEFNLKDLGVIGNGGIISITNLNYLYFFIRY
jgi:hypothetical protein